MPKTTHSPADAHTPLLIVLSGPSGVGKDTVLARMRELGSPYHFTVTATTRPRREGERDGLDYIFIPERRFLTMKDAGELLEWANVYGNYYGVPRSQVTGALREGKDVVMKIDDPGRRDDQEERSRGLVHLPGASQHGRAREAARRADDRVPGVSQEEAGDGPIRDGRGSALRSTLSPTTATASTTRSLKSSGLSLSGAGEGQSPL